MTANAHTETHCEEAETGADSRETEHWHQMDWEQAHRIVCRLQARIVKAHQEGRWGKVKALQRLLTHSQSGRLLAVKRVTGNQGKNTPIVDGIVWDTPERRWRQYTRSERDEGNLLVCSNPARRHVCSTMVNRQMVAAIAALGKRLRFASANTTYPQQSPYVLDDRSIARQDYGC